MEKEYKLTGTYKLDILNPQQGELTGYLKLQELEREDMYRLYFSLSTLQGQNLVTKNASFLRKKSEILFEDVVEEAIQSIENYKMTRKRVFFNVKIVPE